MSAGAGRFIVIVQDGVLSRAYGVYRSFKAADADAQAWGGFCLPLEGRDAESPWLASLPLTPRERASV